MAGALYIWLIGACFLVVVLVGLLFVGVFYVGHWLERRKGATHGFLEMPTELRGPSGSGGGDTTTEAQSHRGDTETGK